MWFYPHIISHAILILPISSSPVFLASLYALFLFLFLLFLLFLPFFPKCVDSRTGNRLYNGKRDLAKKDEDALWRKYSYGEGEGDRQ
jgi:hypothetical protein